MPSCAIRISCELSVGCGGLAASTVPAREKKSTAVNASTRRSGSVVVSTVGSMAGAVHPSGGVTRHPS